MFCLVYRESWLNAKIIIPFLVVAKISTRSKNQNNYTQQTTKKNKKQNETKQKQNKIKHNKKQKRNKTTN